MASLLTEKLASVGRVLSMLLVCSCCVFSVNAQPDKPPKVTSEHQAAKMAKQQFGGKVLKVSQRTVNGAPGFVVKLVTPKGRIMYVKINAVTGVLNEG